MNWDPVLQTSVSDIETERKTIRGKLYFIRYPFADGSGHISLAAAHLASGWHLLAGSGGKPTHPAGPAGRKEPRRGQEGTDDGQRTGREV